MLVLLAERADTRNYTGERLPMFFGLRVVIRLAISQKNHTQRHEQNITK